MFEDLADSSLSRQPESATLANAITANTFFMFFLGCVTLKIKSPSVPLYQGGRDSDVICQSNEELLSKDEDEHEDDENESSNRDELHEEEKLSSNIELLNIE